MALDMENLARGVISTSANNSNNTFWGGTFSYTHYGVFANEGHRLTLVNPDINVPINDPAHHIYSPAHEMPIFGLIGYGPNVTYVHD